MLVPLKIKEVLDRNYIENKTFKIRWKYYKEWIVNIIIRRLESFWNVKQLSELHFCITSAIIDEKSEYLKNKYLNSPF